jgi:hypothetical protein
MDMSKKSMVVWSLAACLLAAQTGSDVFIRPGAEHCFYGNFAGW